LKDNKTASTPHRTRLGRLCIPHRTGATRWEWDWFLRQTWPLQSISHTGCYRECAWCWTQT